MTIEFTITVKEKYRTLSESSIEIESSIAPNIEFFGSLAKDVSGSTINAAIQKSAETAVEKPGVAVEPELVASAESF